MFNILKLWCSIRGANRREGGRGGGIFSINYLSKSKCFNIILYIFFSKKFVYSLIFGSQTMPLSSERLRPLQDIVKRMSNNTFLNILICIKIKCSIFGKPYIMGECMFFIEFSKV